MKNLLLIISVFYLLTACNSAGSNLQSDPGAINSKPTLSQIQANSVQAIIPPTLSVTVQSHDNESYYTSVSNNMYYVAISVSVANRPMKIESIFIENDPNHVFAISTLASAYNITACSGGMQISSGNSCEIMVQLANQGSPSESNTRLSIVAGGVKYQKTLIRDSSVYVAGDFSQVYPYNGESGILPESGSGNCGTNYNLPCQMVEYNFITGELSSVMTTNDTINGMVIDNSGNIYLAGAFTSASTKESSITGPASGGVSSLILKWNPISNVMSDFIKTTTGGNNYPNGEIYALEYNNILNTVYFAGGFNSVGNYSATQGYPLISYNLTSESFANAFGNDSQNPDAAITAIGFDAESNLYTSGFYSTISGWQFNDGISNRTVNKCILNGGEFDCLNGTDYSVSVSSSGINQEPVYNISFQADGRMYIGGGFSLLSNSYSGLSLGSLGGADLLAFNTNPINSFAYGTWSSYATANPDNAIGFIEAYDNNKFLIGGEFSTIGGIPSDSNPGQCGANNNQSCLLALYDGSNWQKKVTTDGLINVIIISDGISAK